MITLVVLFVVFVCLLIGTIVLTEQQTVKVIEQLGKFSRVANAGLSFKIPIFEYVAGNVDLRIQQLDLKAETKTKDNVFVVLAVSVQYNVLPEKVVDAFYKLANPRQQISAYVYDVVRAQVPKLDLDSVFEKKDDIAVAVQNELKKAMDDFGYGILKALVTEVEPDPKVKASMNEINAAQRIRMAANEKGEAEKILAVKKAEGEAESKKLQGEGIANQRRAIAKGLEDSVAGLEKATGVTASEVINLMLMTQYFDTLKGFADSPNTKVLFSDHTPAGLGNIKKQITEALVGAGEALK